MFKVYYYVILIKVRNKNKSSLSVNKSNNSTEPPGGVWMTN